IPVRPFSQPLTQVIAIPETPVEDSGQAFVPVVDLLLRETVNAIGLYSLSVACGDSTHIFRTARPALDLEDPYTGIHHLVHEVDGFQILGRHDVFVVDFQFDLTIPVLHDITPATDLIAGTPIG